MECGKLTAKLRDAVPVCFIEDGKEVKRFKNIEIPDEIKQLPFVDFKFDVPASGAITFKIMFEAGILPTEWPEARQRKSRKVANAEVEVPHTEITEALALALSTTRMSGSTIWNTFLRKSTKQPGNPRKQRIFKSACTRASSRPAMRARRYRYSSKSAAC